MISCFKGKFKVTSPRGNRTLGGKTSFHGGLDLVALEDKNVYAIASGTVDATPYEANGFGYYVRQLLPDGRRIYYGHMAQGSICVKPGQKIKRGDKLGIMGSTGYSTGAHTHVEIRPKGTVYQSLDISAFTGIPNAKGTYTADGFGAYEEAQNVQNAARLENQTIEYLKKYKFANDLFEKLNKAIANKSGSKIAATPNASENIQSTCGLEEITMNYMGSYKFAKDLYEKLWKAMS